MMIVNKIRNYYQRAYANKHFPTLNDLLFSKKPILAYYGFLGDNNFGDELVYESAKSVFNDCVLLPIQRLMPLSTYTLQISSSIKTSGIIIGGGTLIGKDFWQKSYYKKLIENETPVYIHGTGAHNSENIDLNWSKIFQKEHYGGVRGPMSDNNIETHVHNKQKIVGDAAFAMFTDRYPHQTTTNKTILVNLGTHEKYENQDFCRNEFERFLQKMHSKGYAIKFMPLHYNDILLGISLKEKLPHIILLPVPRFYQDVIQEFSQCTFAIGERLHFVTVALMLKCPIYSINYNDKHEDLLSSLNSCHLGRRPIACTLSSISNSFEKRYDIDWINIHKQILKFKSLQESEKVKFLEVVLKRDSKPKLS